MTKVHIIPASKIRQEAKPEVPKYFGDLGKEYTTFSLNGTGLDFLVTGGTNYYSAGTRYSLHFSDADNVLRTVTGGPLRQGAYAFLTPQATVLSAHPMPVDARMTVAVGDLLVLEGLDTILKVASGGRFEGPKLEVVTTPDATEDHSATVAAENEKAKHRAPHSESYLSG